MHYNVLIALPVNPSGKAPLHKLGKTRGYIGFRTRELGRTHSRPLFVSKPIMLHVMLVSFASLTRSRIPKVLCGVLCSGTKVDTPVDPTKTHLCTNTVLKLLWKIAISSTHPLWENTTNGTRHFTLELQNSHIHTPPNSQTLSSTDRTTFFNKGV